MSFLLLGRMKNMTPRRRRHRSPVLAGGECLERRLALAVDVTLSGSTLSLVYGAVGDAATLAIDGDFNYTVTGADGTVVTGSAASGSFQLVFSVVVVNGSDGGDQSFTLTGSPFLQVLSSLTVGSSTAGISNVTITSPEYFGTNGAVAIYADDVTIATTVYGPGSSLVIVATDTVAIDSIDEFSGSISITCQAFSMSGSLLNDGFQTSGPGTDSFSGGNGSSISITATDTIVVAGAVSSNGGSCIIESSGTGTITAGNGGAISLVAGGAITVSGGLSAAGGSVTTTGGAVTVATAGAGGSIAITSGGTVTVGGMSVAGGSTQSGTATTATGGAAGSITMTAADGIAVSGSISAAGGTGQTSSGANGSIEIGIEPVAVASSLAVARGDRRRRPFIRTAGIVGGDVRLDGGTGVIQLRGDITAGHASTTPGSIRLDGDVTLQRGVRLDTTAAGSGSFVIVTGALDGRHPLVVAAGSGSVQFGGAIGGVQPLAGIRFESAGSVVARQRIRLNGAAPGGLRHGIELAPGVNNVNLAQGGAIVNFRSGQAIHAPGNTRDSVITGFRIANAGQPFFGAGDSSGTTIAANVVVQPVFRKATATISMVGGSYGGGIQLSGQARSGDTVTLYVDGKPIGSTTAAHGRWAIASVPLAAGRHTVQVRPLSVDGVAGGFSRPRTITAGP